MRSLRLGRLILRFGLGLTFIYIGYAIWQDPAGWAGFIKPWAQEMLLTEPATFMRGAAVFDIVVGMWLLLGMWTWLAALVAGLHLAGVMLGIGLNDVSARDFGLLASCLALAALTLPQSMKNRLHL